MWSWPRPWTAGGKSLKTAVWTFLCDQLLIRHKVKQETEGEVTATTYRSPQQQCDVWRRSSDAMYAVCWPLITWQLLLWNPVYPVWRVTKWASSWGEERPRVVKSWNSWERARASLTHTHLHPWHTDLDTLRLLWDDYVCARAARVTFPYMLTLTLLSVSRLLHYKEFWGAELRAGIRLFL